MGDTSNGTRADQYDGKEAAQLSGAGGQTLTNVFRGRKAAHKEILYEGDSRKILYIRRYETL